MKKSHISISQIVTCLLLLSVFLPISARQLNVEDALESAGRLTDLPILRTSRSGQSFRLVHTEEIGSRPTVYILNRDGGGFLILPADDVAAPVLGYSDCGTIDPSDMPVNMQSWLEYYSNEILSAASDRQSTPYYMESTGDSRRPIAPLLKTTWGQGAPYNNLCPMLGSERCYAGCVVAAIAQITKYHSWPLKGKGSWSYHWSGQEEDLECNYEDLTFEWDKMLDTYLVPGTGIIGTSEQQEAVAKLVVAIGIGSNMKFSTSASATSAWNSARALIENFDYDKGINYLERQYYTLDEWTAMVYDELAANRPVYYEGYNHAGGKGSGHAFVVDGYDKDGYFHLNWGWNGTSDGYFLLTALNPREQGIGGSPSGYNGSQAALFGVQKPVAGSSLSYVFRANGNFTTDKANYQRPDGSAANEKVTFRFVDGAWAGYLGLMCIPTAENTNGIQATPAVRLVSADDGSVYYADATVSTFRRGNVMSNYAIEVSKFNKEGTFYVTPVVKFGDRYEDVHVAVGYAGRLRLTVDGGNVKFVSDAELPKLTIDEISLNGATEIVSGKTCSISATISNSGAEYYGSVYPCLYLKGSDTPVTRMSEISVDITKNSIVTVDWNEAFFDQIETGEYILTLVDASGKRLGTGIEVSGSDGQPVRNILVIDNYEFPNAAGTYEFTNKGKTEIATKQYKTIKVNLRLQCTSGTFKSTTVNAYVYDMDGNYRGDIASYTISLAKGESVNLTFAKDINRFFMNGTLKVGQIYRIQTQTYTNGSYSEPLMTPDGRSEFYIYITNESSGIGLIEADTLCRVYPNPAESDVTISSEYPIGSISVYSMTGAKVLDRYCSGENTSESLVISALPAGHYLIRIISSNGNHIQIARLIKR